MTRRILELDKKEDEKILRKSNKPFDFDKHSKTDIEQLIKEMRKIMEDADGVGLAGPQIGLNESVFVAKWDNKFYAFFNPKIEKYSKEEDLREEGCLSIPGKYGETSRAVKITLVAQNKQGKIVKVKAWGMLAIIFQHEVDHLNGKLFVDRMEKKGKLRGSI